MIIHISLYTKTIVFIIRDQIIISDCDICDH